MSSTFFTTISVYIQTQVHFFSTMLTQIADSFQLEEEVVDLPKPTVQWFKSNLDNFDLSDAGLENVQLFVENTSPLLESNVGHLPHDFRVIVNRFVTGTLKKEGTDTTNKKRGRGEQSRTHILKQRYQGHHSLMQQPSTFTNCQQKHLKVSKLLGLDLTIAQSTLLKLTQLKRPDLNGL